MIVSPDSQYLVTRSKFKPIEPRFQLQWRSESYTLPLPHSVHHYPSIRRDPLHWGIESRVLKTCIRTLGTRYGRSVWYTFNSPSNPAKPRGRRRSNDQSDDRFSEIESQVQKYRCVEILHNPCRQRNALPCMHHIPSIHPSITTHSQHTYIVHDHSRGWRRASHRRGWSIYFIHHSYWLPLDSI